MYDRKCIDGDSDHGNTAGADGLNTGRMVLKNRNVEVGSYVSARYA